ncbi:hypothetical protein J4772_19255 [Cohnella sp. LGH]|uniref:stalk domain-containing protein n=1 Tax=Cohnella sp. LGH TaxID=1619153 RepID=UPI001ADC8374|nr:stalk domain-containing protein [Cohnella sp. LGH]QTH39779.1 hypothetical protein J4772_19255 [Cohnella sp. LGH]
MRLITLTHRFALKSLTFALAALVIVGGVDDSRSANAAEAVDNSKLIVDVAMGNGFALAVAKDGTLWSWGSNGGGRLGLGETAKATPTPVKVQGINRVIAVSAGINHAMTLKADGTVWAWGFNMQGELGNGTYTEYGEPDSKGARRISIDRNGYVPQQVPGLAGIVGIAATNAGGIAWNAAGELWKWGDAGNGTVAKERLSPQKNEAIASVVFAAAGTGLLAAVVKDGTVWTQGWNTFGQLGDGKRDESGRIAVAQVEGVANIERVVTNGATVLAFQRGGKVFEWGISLLETKGLNQTDPADRDKMQHHLQPTASPELQGFSEIRSTTYLLVKPSFLGLKPDGTVWTFGDNALGQLGVSGPAERYSWGQVSGLPSIATVEGAYGSNVAVGTDGSVWAWGRNDYGQLGDGTTIMRKTPVAIGGFGSAPVKPELPTQYKLIVNGKEATLATKPVVKGTTVTLPLADAAKAFGAKVSFDKNKTTATITRGKSKLVLKSGNAQAIVNGKTVKLASPVPKSWQISAEWLVKQLGGTVKVDSSKLTIVVTLK